MGKLRKDSGVPQGSVLGPLLFVLFINDIVCHIPVKIRLYAADCVIYTEVNSAADQSLLSDPLNKIVQWCDMWQMCINYEKTVFMRVTHKKSPLTFILLTAVFFKSTSLQISWPLDH